MKGVDMRSEALVQLALEALSCTQKDLAVRLKVSPTQVSKWKKGEHMSTDMEEKLRSLSQIGDMDPDFVVFAGSVESAKKWDSLIHHLADVAEQDAETGYNTEPLQDDMGLLSWQTLHTLREMGVELPKVFPEELDFDYEEGCLDDKSWDVVLSNPYSSLILSIFRSLNNVFGFYAAYVFELVFDDELDLHGDVGGNIDSCLLELAAAKLSEAPAIALNYAKFKHETLASDEKWLNLVKERAFRAGIPLRAELLNMVYDSEEALGVEAEGESLGFNKSRLHPDIYMNELLTGMRVIHQVLPVILKKLGISEEELKLDSSELSLGQRN
jgi:transcriptional regulator with XRE-family HTH domain